MAGVRDNCHDIHCFPIYPREDGHITEINTLNKKKALGSREQFCAAFYHVPPGFDNFDNKQGETHTGSCLDKNCKFNGNPMDIAVVAFVKFENKCDDPVYEARYTKCYVNKLHAENFFECDIRHGVLTDKVEENHDGTITLYLTYQPCNKSTEDTELETRPNQSCCDILKRIYFDILQPKGIRLRIKITHEFRLGRQQQGGDKELRQKRTTPPIFR
ncbi:predicted protein [Paramuricea clavata]|uniref:Uncharacterized protein n=1 Tax=Paramuricea clavata TaxID=317549 RepID=A0A7D9MH89_PARCT|nr:predicted protein [Paramuricea clavata]